MRRISTRNRYETHKSIQQSATVINYTTDMTEKKNGEIGHSSEKTELKNLIFRFNNKIL
jgi:hypothetical protein